MSTDTVDTTTEILFERDVPIREDAILHVRRDTSDTEESITGACADGKTFGNWCSEEDGPVFDTIKYVPSLPDIEVAVSEALGFEVLLHENNIDWGENDSLTLTFERDTSDPAAEAPAVAKAAPPATELERLQARITELEGIFKRYDDQYRVCIQADIAAAVVQTDANEAHKVAKEQTKRLKELWRAIKEPLPLFDGRTSDGTPCTITRDSGPETLDPSTEAWRPETMASLGLSPGIVTSLHEANIDTLGQWCDFKSKPWFQPPKGIGKAKMDKIDDAVEKYFTEHKEHCRPQPCEPPAENHAGQAQTEAAPPEPEEADEYPEDEDTGSDGVFADEQDQE